MAHKHCHLEFYWVAGGTYDPPEAIFPLLLACSTPITGGGLVVGNGPAGTLDEELGGGGTAALTGIVGLDGMVIATCDCCCEGGEDNDDP